MSDCQSTFTAEDGVTYECAGIVCPMFPGCHKAWAVDVTWSDEDTYEQWADRLYHEQPRNEDGRFVTCAPDDLDCTGRCRTDRP